jgi:hypothetical protein
VIAHKFLRSGGRSPFSGFRWPLPGDDGGPGPWVEAPVEPCRSGIHACRPADLPVWVADELYEIELDGEIVHERTKVVAPRARLLRRVDAWEQGVRDAYVRMCAERAHALAQELPAWEATIDPLARYGAALLGYMAARIAEERGGPPANAAERAHHAARRLERLGRPAAPRPAPG